MSLTVDQLLDRVVVLETALNDIQTAMNNLASRRDVKNLFAVLNNQLEDISSRSTEVDADDVTDTVTANLQSVLDNLATRKELKNLLAILSAQVEQLRIDIEQIELTGSGSALANHKIDPSAHSQLDERYFPQDDFVTTSAGVMDAGKPVILSASGVLDSSLLPGGTLTDHGLLGGLSDDDHSLYHTDGRALSWLGTRSTSDLSEGTNLYFTDARVAANAAVQSGLSAAHTRLHSMDSSSDHAAAGASDYGKYVRANPSTGAIEFAAVSGSTDTAAMANFRHVYGNSGISVYVPLNMPYIGVGSNAFNLGADIIRAYPFIAPARGGTINTVVFRTTSSNANAVMRLGIYTNSGSDNIYPASSVYSSNEIDTSVAGNFELTVNLTLTAGKMYWVALLNGGATTAIVGIDVANQIKFLLTETAGSETNYNSYGNSLTYTTLPSTFPAGCIGTSTIMPLFRAKFSA